VSAPGLEGVEVSAGRDRQADGPSLVTGEFDGANEIWKPRHFVPRDRLGSQTPRRAQPRSPPAGRGRLAAQRSVRPTWRALRCHRWCQPSAAPARSGRLLSPEAKLRDDIAHSGPTLQEAAARGLPHLGRRVAERAVRRVRASRRRREWGNTRPSVSTRVVIRRARYTAWWMGIILRASRGVTVTPRRLGAEGEDWRPTPRPYGP